MNQWNVTVPGGSTDHCWNVGIQRSHFANKGCQIIATSHGSLTPNGGLVREIPLFQGNLGWWNIIIWPDVSNLSTKQVVCFATQHSFLQTIHPLNLLVTWILKIGGLGRCFSFSKGIFSGSMLVFGGVFIPSSFVLKLPLNDAWWLVQPFLSHAKRDR